MQYGTVFTRLNVLLSLPCRSLREPAVPAQVNWCALTSIFPFSASLNWWSPIILTPSFSQAGCGVFSFFYSIFSIPHSRLGFPEPSRVELMCIVCWPPFLCTLKVKKESRIASRKGVLNSHARFWKPKSFFCSDFVCLHLREGAQFFGRLFPLLKKGFQIQEPERSAFPSSLPCSVMRTAGWNRMAAALLYWEKRECKSKKKNEAWWWRIGARKGGIGEVKPCCDAGTQSGASNPLSSKVKR